MVNTELRQFIQRLPKAELHVHLEGTLEPELRSVLAQRNGIDTNFDASLSYNFDSLSGFLAEYYAAMEVLQTEQDFFDLASSYFKRAQEEGIVRAEVFFDPQAHTSRGVAFDDVINGIHRAKVQAEESGLSVGLILCFLRDMSEESALETMKSALKYHDWLLGVGLDSDEAGNPPEKFRACFDLARKHGLQVTMHCDPDQPESIKNIRTALLDLKTERLDHGINIVEDPELVEFIKQHRIAMTCCPLSNIAIHGDSKTEPTTQLLDAGVLVTINSDDPAYFNGYLIDNFEFLAKESQLDTKQLVQLARNSITACWLPESEKATFFAELDALS